jgi:thioesterase domain-containing protein
VLFRSRTIRLLAREIAEVKERNNACMVEIQPLGKGTPLVVLHGLGGEVLYWSRVARHLPRDQIILGFQPPFVNGAFHAFADLPSMAARYVRELSELRLGEAVVLAGFCSGAVIAFEMARQLAAEGRPVTRVVMIEPSPARHRPLSASTFLRALPAVMANVPRWIQIELLRCDRTERRQLLERSFALSWRRLRASLRPSDAALARGAFEEFLELDSLPEDQRAMKEAHYAALEAFAPEPYGGAVTVVRARVNELFTLPDAMLGWDEVATHATLEVVEGSHLRLFSEPYVEPLARRLTDLLERPTLHVHRGHGGSEMAVENVIAFWEHVEKDKKTQGELEKNLKSADLSKKKAALLEVQKLAQSKGYSFKVEDLDEFFARAPKESGELSEKDLTSITGGVTFSSGPYIQAESFASSYLSNFLSPALKLQK